jgi:TfoX/Sxy family transcriptional regulator of competence genes
MRMAYDVALIDRVQCLLNDESKVSQIKMFGGIVFMVNGNMCCGVSERDVVVRVGPEYEVDSHSSPDVRPVIKGKRPMAGFLYVGGQAIQSDDGLRHLGGPRAGAQPHAPDQVGYRAEPISRISNLSDLEDLL